MKGFYLITCCLVVLAGHSQKNGFDVIQIGKNIFDPAITNNYKQEFSTTDSLVFRLEGKGRKTICDEGIDYLNVEINPDSTIKKIDLYTIGMLYPEQNDFLTNYKKISQCMVTALGKPDYVNNGKNKKDGLVTAGWLFPESKIMFIIYAYNLPFQANMVKRLYKMVWRTYDPTDPKPGW